MATSFMGEREEVEQMYRDLGSIMNDFPSWSVYILTSHEGFEKLYGKPATKKRKLFNGFIKTDYYQYFGKHL
jgi:putative N6-adenine-specific DNA methylase